MATAIPGTSKTFMELATKESRSAGGEICAQADIVVATRIAINGRERTNFHMQPPYDEQEGSIRTQKDGFSDQPENEWRNTGKAGGPGSAARTTRDGSQESEWAAAHQNPGRSTDPDT